MTKRIVWIDDNTERQQLGQTLQDTIDIKTDFVTVEGKNLKEEMLKLVSTQEPDLLIIDHVLDKAITEDWTKYGSTLANILREKGWETCPIIGVTAADKYVMVDIERYNYDDLIQFENFSDYVEYIPNIIEGFEKCKKVDSIDKLINLLGTPEIEKERLTTSLPHNLKTEITKKRFPSRVHHWFKNRFHKYAGFLLDTMWVATFIGVKNENIQEYLQQLETAKYNGIFDNPKSPRWWRVKLYESIFGNEEPENIYKTTQEKACEKLNVQEVHKSECYACHDKWPEIMAYVDESDNADIKQMHLRCTTSHPNYSPEPTYEEISLMKEQ